MKSNIKVFLLIFTTLGFIFSGCNKSDDLLTKDAKTGGLVVPSSSIPYKLGNTPDVAVALSIPMGPGITSVEVYNKYFSVGDTTESNLVLMKTVDVASSNVGAAVAKDYTLVYADLIKDLILNGAALPTDEGLLPIGDYWELSYISVMADGRKVVNNATTTISVANLYAGLYQCDGIFTHPVNGPRTINEEKFLTPLSAYSCRTNAGDLGASGYTVDITVDPITNSISFSNGVPTGMFPQAGKPSYYEPSTGKIYLHYFYVGATGNRLMDETYTPIN